MPRAKSAPVAKVEVKVEPAATIKEGEARALDATINEKIRSCNEKLAVAYLDLAGALKEMNETRGYLLLVDEQGKPFQNWEAYLASKREFGRTYLSYLFKLGRAGDLKQYLDKGMAASVFIEYAKKVDYPEKIPQVIEATVNEVKDLPVRKAAEVIGQYVAEHKDEFKRERKKTGAGRKPVEFRQKLHKLYMDKPESERDGFLKEVQAFIKMVKKESVG
jgi:hypothetical protein